MIWAKLQLAVLNTVIVVMSLPKKSAGLSGVEVCNIHAGELNSFMGS